MRRLLAVLVLASTFVSAQTPAAPVAKDIVARWAAAVHAPQHANNVVQLTSKSNEDGIDGRTDETFSPDGSYHAVVTRKFDEAEFLVTPDLAQRRDWNGFVRSIKGRELERLRAAVFQTRALVFGPPAELNNAEVAVAGEGKSNTLTYRPMLSSEITWTVDAATGLPLKSTAPGDDTVITTTYEDWRDFAGVRMPHRFAVNETDKPGYTVEVISLSTPKLPPTVAALTPGPSDVTLDPNAPPIPFEMASAHIIFKASLNGRPPIWWLLDTGADQEVINSTRVKSFGLTMYGKTVTSGGGNSAEYDYATGATFTLPGVTLRNQHVATIDETGLERALGIPLGGLLGYDFISRFVVEIDYEKKLITLHDPATWQFSGTGYIVPLTFDNGIPFTNGTITVGGQKIPAYLVIDFGAQETITLTSPFVKEHDLVHLAQTNATVTRPTGLEKEFFAQNNVRGHVDALDLANLHVSDIPINMSVNTTGAYASKNFAGTVGESIFRRYHVFLDYARERIILQPTAEVNKPFPERMTYGLSLLASGEDLHTYTVVAVRTGSPAEKDGFRKGDIIASLDGKTAVQFTLADLRDGLSHDGDHHNIQVARGGKPVPIAVQVKLVSLDR